MNACLVLNFSLPYFQRSRFRAQFREKFKILCLIFYIGLYFAIMLHQLEQKASLSYPAIRVNPTEVSMDVLFAWCDRVGYGCPTLMRKQQ